MRTSLPHRHIPEVSEGPQPCGIRPSGMAVQLHLQVLLFPGEGVRQVLDVPRLALLHVRMERLQKFADQRADLLGHAARLLDFVNLQQASC